MTRSLPFEYQDYCNANYSKEDEPGFKDRWNIRCDVCGKFISGEEIELKRAKYYYKEEDQFGPEESFWTHTKCDK